MFIISVVSLFTLVVRVDIILLFSMISAMPTGIIVKGRGRISLYPRYVTAGTVFIWLLAEGLAIYGLIDLIQNPISGVIITYLTFLPSINIIVTEFFILWFLKTFDYAIRIKWFVYCAIVGAIFQIAFFLIFPISIGSLA